MYFLKNEKREPLRLQSNGEMDMLTALISTAHIVCVF